MKMRLNKLKKNHRIFLVLLFIFGSFDKLFLPGTKSQEITTITSSELQQLNVAGETLIIPRQAAAGQEDESEEDGNVNSASNNQSNQNQTTAMNMLFNQVLPAFGKMFTQFTNGLTSTNEKRNESILQSAANEFAKATETIAKPLIGKDGIVFGAFKEMHQIIGSIIDEHVLRRSTTTVKSIISTATAQALEQQQQQQSINIQTTTNSPVKVQLYPVPDVNVGAFLPSTTTTSTISKLMEMYAKGILTLPTESFEQEQQQQQTTFPTANAYTYTTKKTNQFNRHRPTPTKPEVEIDFEPNQSIVENFNDIKIKTRQTQGQRIVTTSKSFTKDYDNEILDEEDKDNITIEPTKLTAFLLKYQYNKSNNNIKKE